MLTKGNDLSYSLRRLARQYGEIRYCILFRRILLSIMLIWGMLSFAAKFMCGLETQSYSLDVLCAISDISKPNRKRPTKAEKMGLAANKQKNPSKAANKPQPQRAGPSKAPRKIPAAASVLDQEHDIDMDDDVDALGESSSASRQAAAKQELREQVALAQADQDPDVDMSMQQPKKKKAGLKAKAKEAIAAASQEEGAGKERPDYVDMFDKSMKPRRRHK